MAQSPLCTRLPSFSVGFRADGMEVKSKLSLEPLGTLGDNVDSWTWDTH